MPGHTVVTSEEWLRARLDLLEQEKELTRQRERLNLARRNLPWEKVEKVYRFETAAGGKSLSDLFDGSSQLIVYHFMYGADWDAGCPSCSYWADNFNGIAVHLKQRDIAFVSVSRAPLATLLAFRERMGWHFDWVSSQDSDFNEDYQVSFASTVTDEKLRYYNYSDSDFSGDEAPGISVFAKDEDGFVFHTYSCYARGLDMLNGAYHYMDLVPKGRDEDDLPWPMAWVARRDEYKPT